MTSWYLDTNQIRNCDIPHRELTGSSEESDPSSVPTMPSEFSNSFIERWHSLASSVIQHMRGSRASGIAESHLFFARRYDADEDSIEDTEPIPKRRIETNYNCDKDSFESLQAET